ncbi:MAG: nuclear transport factor 2 family protein [Candidatus Eremiobacteraeota bacterium]|nr:nuclear transport factor 2 family protein [Candidatus Eremiobacteraeota bacterium]
MTEQSDIVATILELNLRLQDATRRHDAQAVRALIPDDFSLITTRGRIFSASDLLAEIADPAVNWFANDTEDAAVRAYGKECAIITATLHERYELDGKVVDHRLRFTDTWVVLDGVWKYVAGHASMLTA